MADEQGMSISESAHDLNSVAGSFSDSGQIAGQSVWSVLMLSMIFLAFAHLAIKEFFPHPAIWLIGAMMIVVLAAIWIVVLKNDFGFLLALFICVHFSFADTQGGLWSYVIFAAFIVKIALRGTSGISFSSVPTYLNFFILVYILQQILGTVSNSYSLVSNIQGMIIVAAQIIIFYYCASQKITESRLKLLLSAWGLVVIWLFLIAINQKYHWVVTLSPILPQIYKGTGMFAKMGTIPSGSFQNTELFAEYFCIIFAMSLVVISHLKEMADLNIKRFIPLMLILFSIAAMIMARSRAAVVLAVAAAIYITFLNFIVTPSWRSMKRAVILSLVLLCSGVLITQMGSFFSMDKMVAEFQEMDKMKIDSDTVVSGRGINRNFTGAYHILYSGSYWIGQGYNVPDNNHKSLRIPKGVADYHSLYICLPFFFGWFGAVSYVLLILGSGFRIYIYYLRNKRLNHYLVPIALGLSVVWGIFLIDQYKISVTRNPSYFLLTWMLLGWTHAVANSLRQLKKKENIIINHQ